MHRTAVFSPRARRRSKLKQRFQRTVIATWAATVVGALAGVPFADAGFGLTEKLAQVRPAGGIETTESAVGLMHFRTTMFKTRPGPEPKAEGSREAPPTSIAGIIYAAAREFGIDGDYLYGVALCESDLDTQAHNAAGYHGLFQFDSTTWAAYGYGSIYDPTAQARTAARLLAAGQTDRWPNCA